MKTTTICVTKSHYTLPATGIVWGLSAGLAFAAASASDSASNYVSVWGTSAPNNGTGFGNWSFVGGQNNTYYSTYLAGISDTPIVDTGGNAWAITVNHITAGFLQVGRAFSAGPSGSTSLFNQTISFDLAVSGVPAPSPDLPPGDFEASVGGVSLGFQEDGPNPSYTFLYNATSATTVKPAISLSQWEAGLAVSIAVSGPLNSTSENYTVTVSPFSGGPTIYSNSGTFDTTRFAPNAVDFFSSGLDGAAYFNSLNVTSEPVPEPSTIGLLGIGLAGIVWRRRK